MGFLDWLKRAAKGNKWQAWVAERGYQFDAEAPDLAGQFFPPAPGRDTGEKYFNVVRGVNGGRRFVAFHRQMGGRLGGQPNYEVVAVLALQLPERPRQDLAALSPKQAFRQIGGRAGSWQWRWHEPDWLVGTKNHMNPDQLERELTLKAEQLAAIDPAAWESR